MSEEQNTEDVAKLKTDMAVLAKTVEFQEKIDSTEKSLDAKIEGLKTQFNTLNVEVKKDSNFYKWVAGSGALVALILGVIGYSQWSDVIKEFRAKSQQTSEYQSNLASGLGMYGADRPDRALPYLRKCYKVSSEDEAVAGAYLWALEETDRWPEASDVANKLKTGGEDKITDLWARNNVGRSLLFQAQDDKNKLKEAEVYLVSAAAGLQSDPDIWKVETNLWILYLAQDNLSKAEDSLRSARSAQDPHQPLDKSYWTSQIDWVVFQDLEKISPKMKVNAQKSIADVIR